MRRITPKSKRTAQLLGLGVGALHIIDWLVGKLGYLGVFTSPEDFRTMMERAPIWLKSIWTAASPVLLAIAGWIVDVWSFLVSPFGSTLAMGLFVVALMVDMDRLTRAIRGLWYRARHAVSEKVWIGEEAALALLRGSQWGRLVAPFTEESMFNAFTLPLMRTTGLSDLEKDRLKFRLYLQATLRSFAAANPVAVRELSGASERQYDEVALRAFLQAAIDEMVASQFGKPPSFNVT